MVFQQYYYTGVILKQPGQANTRSVACRTARPVEMPAGSVFRCDGKQVFVVVFGGYEDPARYEDSRADRPICHGRYRSAGLSQRVAGYSRLSRRDDRRHLTIRNWILDNAIFSRQRLYGPVDFGGGWGGRRTGSAPDLAFSVAARRCQYVCAQYRTE